MEHDHPEDQASDAVVGRARACTALHPLARLQRLAQLVQNVIIAEADHGQREGEDQHGGDGDVPVRKERCDEREIRQTEKQRKWSVIKGPKTND